MKKLKIATTLLLLLTCIGGNTLHAKDTEFDNDKIMVPKEPFVPTTEYDKKLAEFTKPKSKPKFQMFGNIDERSDHNISEEEHKILSEMKMKESERIMKENDGTKEDNEWEKSRPVGYAEEGITNFNVNNWSYYLPQQWQA